MRAGNPLSCFSSGKYFVCCLTFDFVGHFKTHQQSLLLGVVWEFGIFTGLKASFCFFSEQLMHTDTSAQTLTF